MAEDRGGEVESSRVAAGKTQSGAAVQSGTGLTSSHAVSSVLQQTLICVSFPHYCHLVIQMVQSYSN